jgi:hypothetical protein
MSEEKKKVKWADIERIRDAFYELESALFAVDEPIGITIHAVELVRKAREEASGALLFAEFEDGEGNPWIPKECLEKLKLEWLEKKVGEIHDYCKYCPSGDTCGKGGGIASKMQKDICDRACAAICGRLGLTEGTFGKAMIEIAKEKYAKDMRWFFGDRNEEAEK